MNKVKGILYFVLSVILGLWCLLSILGLLGRISNGLPQDSYSWGVLAGQIFVYLLFGLLSIRAFKAGRKNLSKNESGQVSET